MSINVFGGGYNPLAPVFPVQRSVRLRSSASAYFARTPASASNRKTWTYSGWIKRGAINPNLSIMGAQANALANTQRFNMYFDTNNCLVIGDDQINISANLQLITTQVFRDSSAWYHIVLAMDTTQATSSNRVKLYINGVQVTAFSTATYPSLNFDTAINNNVAQYLGYYNNLGTTIFYYDGYETEINLIDGQALTPSSFGSYNAGSGVWQPIRYSGTYGTNGFYLNFQDNSGATATTIGKDSSGNGNNWTPNNISVTAGITYDSMLDVPTLTSPTNANFCVLNPLQAGNAPSNGNLSATTSGTAHRNTLGTIFFPSGKYYYEVSVPSIQRVSAGMATSALTLTTVVAGQTAFLGFYGDSTGSTVYNGASSLFTQSAVAANDVYQFCVDASTGNAWFGRNNTFYSSAGAATGNPATGVNPTWTGVTLTNYAPEAGVYDAGTTANANFGQRPFSYTPPTGFKSLNTYNLPTPTIPNGATQMAATTYTGNGSSVTVTNTINGASMQPDFVWIKGRSGATDHQLLDSVRTTNNVLVSNSTAAEVVYGAAQVLFYTNGFGVGGLAAMNTNAATYVGWQWKASNAAAVTNTSGSISSQVSANPTAGFSVVTYTGTGANATVGHGLGVAPKFIITKSRSAVQSWYVYHVSIGGTKTLYLNLTDAAGTDSRIWNNTDPTSSVFSIGTVGPNASAVTQVAYCFAEIAGYSKFGSYTGNGSADGPFIYTGFRPRFILYKSATEVANWTIVDTSRTPSNIVGNYLHPNLANADNTFALLDIVSNGFKLRTTIAGTNASGQTYIYAAFAENPFTYSLAR